MQLTRESGHAAYALSADTLAEGIHLALSTLNNGRDTFAKDWGCLRKEIALDLIVRHPTAEPRLSMFVPCGETELQQYIMEIRDGLLDRSVDYGLEPYCYHQRFAVQLEGALKALRDNPSSTRAVCTTLYPQDVESEHKPCVTTIQLLVRENDDEVPELNMFVTIRSNDAVKAFPMNIIAFSFLLEDCGDKLRECMPTLQVGYVRWSAASFHAYERDFDSLRKLTSRDWLETAIDYSEWSDEMNTQTPLIQQRWDDYYNRKERELAESQFSRGTTNDRA